MIKIGALIKELDSLSESQIPVRETARNIDLILLFCGEDDRSPLAEMGRSNANIHGYVQSLALDHAAKFCLCMPELVMESADCAFGQDARNDYPARKNR